MSIKCKLFSHKMDGCVCERCNFTNHNWNFCKCTKCGAIRDENHNLNSTCSCTVCGQILHDFHGGKYMIDFKNVSLDILAFLDFSEEIKAKFVDQGFFNNNIFIDYNISEDYHCSRCGESVPEESVPEIIRTTWELNSWLMALIRTVIYDEGDIKLLAGDNVGRFDGLQYWIILNNSTKRMLISIQERFSENQLRTIGLKILDSIRKEENPFLNGLIDLIKESWINKMRASEKQIEVSIIETMNIFGITYPRIIKEEAQNLVKQLQKRDNRKDLLVDLDQKLAIYMEYDSLGLIHCLSPYFKYFLPVLNIDDMLE